MSRQEAAEVARVIRRASLSLPLNHPGQKALYEAHNALMAKVQSTNIHGQTA